MNLTETPHGVHYCPTHLADWLCSLDHKSLDAKKMMCPNCNYLVLAAEAATEAA